MLSPTTPAKRIGPSSNFVRLVPAFSQPRQDRPSHRDFRGRLGVHACYGLPTCRRPFAAFCLPSFERFVTSTSVRIATRPGRPLPGQDSHLLEQRTFHGTPGLFHRAVSPLRLGCEVGQSAYAGPMSGSVKCFRDNLTSISRKLSYGHAFHFAFYQHLPIVTVPFPVVEAGCQTGRHLWIHGV